MDNITLGQVAAGMAFLVALFSGLGYFLKPVNEFRDKQRSIDARIEKIEQHQDNDNKRLAQLENDTKQILLSVNVLMEHSVDNDDDEKLKKRKSELERYLIER